MAEHTPARNPGPEMTEQASRDEPRTTTFNILFVCTGNTCRSPMAEGIARAELRERGWAHVQVRSAGVAADVGGGASPEGVAVAERHGIDITAHRSQPLSPELIAWADVVLAMSPSHLPAVDRLGGAEKSTTLGDFAAGGQGMGPSIHDPFGGPEAAYEETYRELKPLVSAALDRLGPILHP
jgi:protein-tyrosine-phosphatase